MLVCVQSSNALIPAKLLSLADELLTLHRLTALTAALSKCVQKCMHKLNAGLCREMRFLLTSTIHIQLI